MDKNENLLTYLMNIIEALNRIYCRRINYENIDLMSLKKVILKL